MDFIELQNKLNCLGIQKDDILYVSSDVSLLLYEEVENENITTKEEKIKYLDKLIDSLKQLVGETGTLLFPVFTWDFCLGKCFDYLNTLGKCGALSNRALERNDFVRTLHPMYSFCVYGKYADYLKGMNNRDAWGNDSPFAWLHEKKAKQLLINVIEQRSFTFIHYVEQKNKVNYRYIKNFKSQYKDEDGKVSEREYSMYVRDLVINPITDIPENFLENNCAARTLLFGNIKLKLIELNKAYNVISKDIQENDAKNLMHY